MNKNLMMAFVIALIFLIVIYMKRNKIVSKIYDEKLSPNFSLGELLVTNKPFPNIPNTTETERLKLLTVNVLQPARNLVGTMVINSAFRSSEVNKAVGGVDNSQHRLGLAADFHTKDVDLDTAFKMIKNSTIPYDQIIIETGSEGERWIHISFNPNGVRRQALIATWNNQTNKMDYKTA